MGRAAQRQVPLVRRRFRAATAQVRALAAHETLRAVLLVLTACLGVAAVASRDGSLAGKGVGLGVAGLAIAAARRRRGLVVLVTVALVPTVPLLPAALLRFGAPLAVVRQYGHIKDLAVLYAVLGLLTATERRRGPLDWVERWGIAFVGLSVAYLVFPLATPGFLAPSTSIRIYGWRQLAEWVVLLLALRRLIVPHGTQRLVLRGVAVLAVLEGVLSLFQRVQAGSWSHFVTSTLQVRRYLQLALDSNVLGTPDAAVHNAFAGIETIRVGGLALQPLSTGGVCIVLSGLLAPVLVAERPHPAQLAALLGSLEAVVLTLTRSALLGCAVAVAFVLFLARDHHVGARTRGVLLVVIGVLAGWPLLAASKVLIRITSSIAGTDSSTQDHVRSTSGAIGQIGRELLGAGLGTGPGVGFRFSTQGTVAENAYIQIALEVGVVGAVCFTAMLVALVRSCLAAYRDDPAHTYPLGAAAATVGLMAMSLLLDPWIDFGTIFLFAAVAGAVPYRRPAATAAQGLASARRPGAPAVAARE